MRNTPASLKKYCTHIFFCSCRLSKLCTLYHKMDKTMVNPASQTLSTKDCQGNEHYFTLMQAKVRNAVQFYKCMGIKYFKKDVFSTFNIFHCQGYEFLRNNSSLRQLYNSLSLKESCGYCRLISVEKICEIEQILQEKGIEVYVMTWKHLGYEVGLECTEQIVKNTIGSLNYRKYIICKKSWVNKKTTWD